MRVRDDDSMPDPEFSMAPLIDVVFQMLVFFLVASSWGAQEKQLELELPSAQSASAPAEPLDELVIDVRRDDSLVLRGHELERSALEGELSTLARANPRLPVTIRGDRLVHHEDIVAVMDACGIAGLTNLAIGTLDTH
ncbi:MAG: biopolymer transporter ExbD [Planctomycetes bacterium]|nr:biopolymer transporter ExbD [Planctomycetota bacterium]